PEESRRKRRFPGCLVVLREELGLVARHVHADRAFRLARLALQAEVERLEHLLARHPGQVAAHRLAEAIRPPARGMLLLERDLEGRAHGADVEFPADGHPAALLDRLVPAAIDRVVVEGAFRWVC